jgi:hypothetical protein
MLSLSGIPHYQEDKVPDACFMVSLQHLFHIRDMSAFVNEV